MFGFDKDMLSTAQGTTSRVSAGKSRGFLSENMFVNALRLERKRSERSGESFLLVLLDLAITEPAELQNLATPAAVICPVVRDTDAVGWYKQDAIVGVIFTHLRDRSRVEAKAAVSTKLARAFAASGAGQKFQHVRISYHFFPAHDGDSASGDPVMDLDKGLSHASPVARALKRTTDVTGSVFCLLLFLPLFLGIAVLIKIGSSGPVFFRQTRLGQYGKPFTFLKFRSMYVNNDPTAHRDYVSRLIAGRDVACSNSQNKRVFKIVDDPRVTRIGRILRKTSLDELPQFINVLKGEMSLIGPRPPLPYEFEHYAIWHRRRIMEVKPGISGLWQVSGRSGTTFDEMVRLDLQYARTWSLWLDFKILLQTPAAVISADGAY
jgi:exopolysaccharide biosynthesis polyprenyl glycosylphosphotransferase